MKKIYFIALGIFITLGFYSPVHAGYNLFSQSFLNLIETKALQQSATFATKIYSPNYQNGKLLPVPKTETFTVNLDAKQDILDASRLKLSQVASITSSKNTLFGFNSTSNEIGFKVDGRILYVQVPIIVFQILGIQDIPTKSQWISINEEDISNLEKDMPFVRKYYSYFLELAQNPSKQLAENKDSWLRFTQALYLYNPKIKNIGGISTTTYNLGLNKNVLKKALIEWRKEMSYDKKISNTELKEIDAQMKTFLLKNATYSMYTKTKLPKTLKGTFETFNKNTKKITSSTNFSIDFSNYNTPIEVIAPENAVSLTSAYNIWFKPVIKK